MALKQSQRSELLLLEVVSEIFTDLYIYNWLDIENQITHTSKKKPNNNQKPKEAF